MKTRRSPRNQARLYKYLFEPPDYNFDPSAPTLAAVKCEVLITPVVSPVCFNCVNYPKSGRARGHCTLHGVRVNGRSVKECYREMGKP